MVRAFTDLSVVSDYLVQCWLVPWVESFGCARVGAFGDAARCDPEGSASDGAADGTALVDDHWGEPLHNVASAHSSAIGRKYWYSGAVYPGLKLVRHFGDGGRQSQQCGVWMTATQDGASHGLLLPLQHRHPLADFLGRPALLEDAGHPIFQAAILGTADCLGTFALAMVVHVIPSTLVRCSRSVLAATPAYPIPPAPATSLTGTAQAASQSSGAPRRGPAPGRLCRTAQPVQASPGHRPESHTHRAGSARLAVGYLVANPVRLVSIGAIAPGRSPARG